MSGVLNPLEYPLASAAGPKDFLTFVRGDGSPYRVALSNINGSLTSLPIVGGIKPKLHLAKLNAAASPIVCIVGDSTMTDGAENPAATRDYFWGYLMRRMREDNPTKVFTFTNYAIGGTTFGNLALTGTALQAAGIALPSWFSTPGNTWISYVNTLQPDVLVFGFGVNDSYSLTAGIVRSILATVNGFVKVPDILFVTCKGANPAAGVPYSQANYQAGYLSAAGVLRACATCGRIGYGTDAGLVNIPPIGLIDTGRRFQNLVNGVDPVAQYYTQVISSALTGITNFPYLFPACAGDFDLSVTFPGQLAAMATAGTSVLIGVGSGASTIPYGPGDAGNFVTVTPAVGGPIYVGYYPGNGFTELLTNGNNGGGADLTINVTAKQDYLYVVTNGGSSYANVDGVYPRTVGPFAPQLSVTSPSAGLTMTVNYFRAGMATQLAMANSTFNVWGELGAPTGGNGINHDSSPGLNAIDYLVLDETTFCAAG